MSWHVQTAPAFAKLPDGVQTGTCPFQTVHEKPLFRWLADQPEQGALFSQAMTCADALGGCLTAFVLGLHRPQHALAGYLVAEA